MGKSKNQEYNLHVHSEDTKVKYFEGIKGFPMMEPAHEMNIQNSQRKFRCVIYDCDGVLFDSFETNRRLYNHICAFVGRPPLTEEESRYAHMHTVFEAIHFIFRND